MIGVDFEEFYKRTSAQGLDYLNLVIHTDPEMDNMLVNIIDPAGFTLLNMDGTDAGAISIHSMEYWQATFVRRQITRGTYRPLSVILGLI